MSKAILELPKMPESCSKCLLQAISAEKQIKYCTVIRCSTDYYDTKRHENCPLKLEKQVPQKVKKYKGLNETACPNCRFVFGDYDYNDEKFDYCYNCGQRLSWESEVKHDA